MPNQNDLDEHGFDPVEGADKCTTCGRAKSEHKFKSYEAWAAANPGAAYLREKWHRIAGD